MNEGTLRGQQNWRKLVAALVLAVALVGVPVLATALPTPVSNFFVQAAYACPLGGNCG